MLKRFFAAPSLLKFIYQLTVAAIGGDSVYQGVRESDCERVQRS